MSESKRKLLFIINPNSGTRRKNRIPDLIEKLIDKSANDYEIVFTTKPKEATAISAARKGDFDTIVAVGGDGTINEVARPIINSDTALGIIPMGSGNGLARHLGIPLNVKKAIKLLNKAHVSSIDTIKLNDLAFLNVAGVGFDAHIANAFATSKKRGFITYAKLTLGELRRFKYTGCKLRIDGVEQIENTPFIVSVANSTQYGNNAKIAPQAHITDGLMDICVLQKIPFWYYPMLAVRLFSGTLSKSKYYSCKQGKEVFISFQKGNKPQPIHLDGDPFVVKNEIKLTINPLSLKVALPDSF
ncbi:MAG: diacylglycerol kinase family protein [Fulvivirga sp.]